MTTNSYYTFTALQPPAYCGKHFLNTANDGRSVLGKLIGFDDDFLGRVR